MQYSSSNLSPERIKQYRQNNGWSQELLAKASGLSLRTIQRAEKDGNSSAETQLALAAAFNISPKELFAISSNPDVNWKRKNIMQSLLALIILVATITLLAMLGGSISWFLDTISALFLVLFMYSCTILSFGTEGLIRSLKGYTFLFAQNISSTPASEYLVIILKKQILFIYAGALIGFLVGLISIHGNYPWGKAGVSSDELTTMLHTSYAVNIIILLYSALFAEVILRPLATKLEFRKLAKEFD